MNHISSQKLNLEIECNPSLPKIIILVKSCIQRLALQSKQFLITHSLPSSTHTSPTSPLSKTKIALLTTSFSTLQSAYQTLQKENQQLHASSTQSLKTLETTLHTSTLTSQKLECVLEELDRKDKGLCELRQENRRLREVGFRVERIERIDGIEREEREREVRIDKEVWEGRQKFRERGVDDYRVVDDKDVGRMSRSLYSKPEKDAVRRMSNVKEKEKGVMDDTFIRQEHLENTNTIDNVMARIDTLERELSLFS